MTDFLKHPRLDVFKSELVKDARFSAMYEFPLIERTCFIPPMAIPFEKASRATNYRQWVHFYTHDRNFECVWREPKRYLEMLKRFDGVITPDYSLYREMPLAMQIWNTYRNRAIGYWLQNNGVSIIPNVRWGDERTYQFAFEGLMTGGTVAVSTNGCIGSKLERRYFQKGLATMVEVLKPETIVNYSQTPDDIFAKYKAKGIQVKQIENYMLTVRNKTAEKAVV